jgi:hypothetical protein
MPDSAEIPDILWHQSGVNQAGEPFVQLLRGTQIIGQMTPTEARDHARAITEAAEAAEQDAFLMSFGRDQLGLGMNEAGLILIAFREYRARTTGKSQGPTNPRDWVMPEKSPVQSPATPRERQQDEGPQGGQP